VFGFHPDKIRIQLAIGDKLGQFLDDGCLGSDGIDCHDFRSCHPDCMSHGLITV
jgi:hypothetical protein